MKSVLRKTRVRSTMWGLRNSESRTRLCKQHSPIYMMTFPGKESFSAANLQEQTHKYPTSNETMPSCAPAPKQKMNEENRRQHKEPGFPQVVMKCLNRIQSKYNPNQRCDMLPRIMSNLMMTICACGPLMITKYGLLQLTGYISPADGNQRTFRLTRSTP